MAINIRSRAEAQRNQIALLSNGSCSSQSFFWQKKLVPSMRGLLILFWLLSRTIINTG